MRFLDLIVTFAFFLESVVRALASTLLPCRISIRSVVFLAASLPVPLQESEKRVPEPVTLQLSLTATFAGLGGVGGLGVAVGVAVAVGLAVGTAVAVAVAVGLAVAVAVGVGITVPGVTPVAGSRISLGAPACERAKSKMLSSDFARVSNDLSPIGGRPQLASMNFAIDACSVCVWSM